MILTIDLDKESAEGLRRAARILEEAAVNKDGGVSRFEPPSEPPQPPPDFEELPVKPKAKRPKRDLINEEELAELTEKDDDGEPSLQVY